MTQLLFNQKLPGYFVWTLNYEIAFYCICTGFILLVRMARIHEAKAERLNITGMHFLTLAVLITTSIGVPSLPFPFDLWPQFGLGIMVYDFLQMKPSTFHKSLSVAGIALTAVVSYRRYSEGYLEGNRNSYICWLVCMAFAVILVLLYRYDAYLQTNRFWKKLTTIGLYSYTIYLVHTVLLAFIAPALYLAHFPGTFSWLICPIILLGVVMICRYLFCVMEQPFIGQLRKNAVASVDHEALQKTASESVI